DDRRGGEGRTLLGLWGEVLDRADRSGPLLIVVDDVQHADQFSFKFLLSLISRLSRQRILVVLGGLDGAESLTLLHSEILRQPQSRRIRLAPLSLAGRQQTLNNRLGPRAALKLATRCQAPTVRNPLPARPPHG